MLIRSQNREILINFNTLAGIEIAEGPIKTIITSCITGCAYLLGEYSTKAKAMKVLDMIQESYTDGKVAQILSHGLGMVPTEEINEAGKIVKNAIQSSTAFQMPEDSEMEA